MTYWLRALFAFLEDPGSVPSTHVTAHKKDSPEDLMPSHTIRQNTHTYKKIN